MAVGTFGHLLALHVIPADVGERQAVARLAAGDTVSFADVDQAYAGRMAAEAAAAERITLEVVKLPEATRGLVLLPRRWTVERSFARATRCRGLVEDYERLARTLARTLARFHVVAFVGCKLEPLAPKIRGA